MAGIFFIFFFFNASYKMNDDTLGWNVWYYLVQNLMTWLALIFSVTSGCIYMYNMYCPKTKKSHK
jgi:hypothetical protein